MKKLTVSSNEVRANQKWPISIKATLNDDDDDDR